MPGTGEANDCGRCGRSHEVWFTVELEDKSHQIVGASCARAANMEAFKRFSAIENSEKLVKKHRQNLADGEWFLRNKARVEREVADMIPPVPMMERSGSLTVMQCGDGGQISFHAMDSRAETLRLAVKSWRRKRMEDRGVKASRVVNLQRLQREVMKAERRLELAQKANQQ